MSRNGSGTYNLPAGNPVVTGTTVSSSWANTTLSDIATALTGSVSADGQTPITSNLPMNSKKITGLAAGTSAGDALSYGQAATFTDLTTTGNTVLGDASTDTAQVSGRLFGTALHNNAGAMTGTVNQYVGSGTYSPTLTSVANIQNSTAFTCQWIRVGNVVHVSGKVNIDPTAPASQTSLGMSLPIASALSAAEQLAGVASQNNGGTPIAAQIAADAANDRAQIDFQGGDANNNSWFFTFTYLVL